ncbi:aminoglycoside phosphotransferase family protein [Paenibacillus hodogayensis]|uniref:Aminoglycoside phosphotransferase family protein n=1 Tax=Paenibacillus hodogayensis TaxID=279208 RepID=A0ABV5VY22_9BACL
MTIDTAGLKRLLAEQFPKWAHLSLEPFSSTGTVNAIYRLGEDMVVRLPFDEEGSEQVKKEYRWLPVLAPYLPLAVPAPLVRGSPGESYPWHWSVYRWLPGENGIGGRIDDPYQTAVLLGQFVEALHGLDASGGPPPGRHNFFRGVPLATRDAAVRQATGELSGLMNTDAILRAWERALQAPLWQGVPVWFHGDLLAGNLLFEQGRLSAVIDFGGLAVGDPACDWLFAWNLLSVADRDKLRGAFSIDDATWARSRGWALSVGVIALPYYASYNPVFAGVARRLIEEALADHREGV